MGAKNVIRKIGSKAGDKLASLATLSPSQVADVQLKRENYLLEKPDPSDELAVERTSRMMAASSVEIFNAFLPQIKSLYLPIEQNAEYANGFNAENNIRYFNITKWVTDEKENNLEKLVNVYAVLSNELCNIALVFNRTKNETNVYLAVVNIVNAENNVDAKRYENRLIEAIRGNFPGAEWANEGAGVLPCLDNEISYSVATASNIPTEKSEKFVSQTIEKLLDGIIPDNSSKEYTIVLLATPIIDVEERKMRLGEFYSGMIPYAQWQTQFTYTENSALGSSATVGVNVGASAGVQNGTNSSVMESESDTRQTANTQTESKNDTTATGESISESESNAHSDGVTENQTIADATNESDSNMHQESKGSSYTEGKESSNSLGVGVTAGGSVTEVIAPGGVGVSATEFGSVSANYNHTWGKSFSDTINKNVADAVTHTQGSSHSVAQSLGKTAADTITKGVTKAITGSVSKSTGVAVANTVGKAVTKAMATTAGISKATSLGANFGANFARSSTVTAMIGKNESISQTFANYNVKHALELLDSQMKRLEQSTALGMWDFAAYVLSEDQDVANNVAHSYLALTLGEESYMSKSAINLWRGKVDEEKRQAKEISDYIRQLRHPVFAINPALLTGVEITTDEDGSTTEMDFYTAYNVYPSVVTATTGLSGKELAYSLNFPQKSIAGLPVLVSAEFGRNVVTYDDSFHGKKIRLGNVYHMRHTENAKVDLNVNSLASHTFITGSTGCGKSNTVYQLLKKAKEKGINFLVVEPAKGEYKNIFGGMKGVSVYGTNPLITPLLRINPFSFPKKIHVLEHMDRLVEIFNVCWPMYAAMPAVLKNAVEKSYADCGWDLIRSVNRYGVDLYPSFADVEKNVKEIIDGSEYDGENKGAYKGALLTRLQSLSNGINGLIFGSDEIGNGKLFDENVIVDLSRVGSSETKSLIMGMLVLKLQEYRMTCTDGMNTELKHITVLEEAHNLLRRTSVEQSQEGSNLLGKSVEMLSNAIAEMRTYGEGFIIADQAPGLMDMSVIRNTNTKIIMRLPDQTDRELVGKAAGLNDDQIAELAKLQCGVAAVYQNEWVQPVLCKVDKYEIPENVFVFKPENDDFFNRYDEFLPETILDCIMNKEIYGKNQKEGIYALEEKVVKSNLGSGIKRDFMEYISRDGKDAIDSLRSLVYELLSAQDAIIAAKQCNDINEWVRNVANGLKPSINKYTNHQIDLAMALILYEQSNRDATYADIFYRFAEVYKTTGKVF